MTIEISPMSPDEVEADVLVLPAGGAHVRRLDAVFDGRLVSASAEADPIAVLPVARELRARRVALVALDASHPDGLRTAAARAVRAARGGTVAWALDDWTPMAAERQVQALVEGAVLGGYDAGRWKTEARAPAVERFVVCGVDEDLRDAAARADLNARWTNVARELVDGPPNLVTPAALAERAGELAGVSVEVLDPADAGLPALAAVGGSSAAAPPKLIVLRHEPEDAPQRPRLVFVGKAVTFDAGGYFLKPQSDIVRQKADMAGGAAVLAALGAVAELRLPVSVVGILPACENMIGADAIRPSDVIATAAGLTVEVTNPDAEGRLILADALWYAQRIGATHVVDLATLTGAMRAGMGDLFGGVFANDENWQDAVVAAGNDSGDHAWPWPLHPRYRRLLESRVADLRNSSGKPFGYPIFAAAFLERFAGEAPWAHVDMLGPALLDEERGDVFGPGATGYGVRMLVELAVRLAAALRRGAQAAPALEAFRRQQDDDDD